MISLAGSPDELEILKQRKLAEMQRKLAEEELRQEQEAQKQNVLRVILTPEARSRLNNLKIVRPEFAEQLELQLIQLAQQGRLPVPLTDEQLKKILLELQSRKRDIKITRL
ncbi:MAG: DNA-binding protein [Candidatus Verstraetearchaeota archaeon]|uniref:DNA-binding protein DSO08_06445 n=1 Tax=Thermoproteota archaeon TaxID=2056631 RepID=A0A523B7B4_9CREN|nr:DNA-binding protein [Candidatus Methanomethylicia archaeon]NHV60212.1 DNA-binding protein [Candidatus Verstraetearchaeota archaeon]TDA36773.1 MAG: DNA-binding protein [Candidatus Verstraetearchaeota archaeon]